MLETIEFLSIMAIVVCAVATAAAIVGGLYLKCRQCCCGCKSDH